MTDAELRALVREAVRRHTAPTAGAPVPMSPTPTAPLHVPATRAAAADVFASTGASSISHALYLTLVNPGDACLIEPAVACNHCGYCQTHGH